MAERPDAMIGYGFKLCRTGAPLANGPLIVTSQLISPPLADRDKDDQNVRADQQFLPNLAPCEGR
ncbi:MAG: hypothetical protein QM699_18845 [Amaricoccus sp.]|uniref:hypothetical protein n=1 Tax=Amaricoccus sp. TaxID=1872485 RepID=UPI0039E6D73F